LQSGDVRDILLTVLVDLVAHVDALSIVCSRVVDRLWMRWVWRMRSLVRSWLVRRRRRCMSRGRRVVICARSVLTCRMIIGTSAARCWTHCRSGEAWTVVCRGIGVVIRIVRVIGLMRRRLVFGLLHLHAMVWIDFVHAICTGTAVVIFFAVAMDHRIGRVGIATWWRRIIHRRRLWACG